MDLFKRLWPCRQIAEPLLPVAEIKPAKRNRHGTLLGLLKPEKASTYDGLTLRMLMSGMPLTVKSLTRFMECRLGYHTLGYHTPNDVGASIRRVKKHLRAKGITVHESNVNPEHGACHKKHWLDADQIGQLQKMGAKS